MGVLTRGAVRPSVSPSGAGTLKSLYKGILMLRPDAPATVGGVVGGAAEIISLYLSSCAACLGGCGASKEKRFCAGADSSGGMGGADGGGSGWSSSMGLMSEYSGDSLGFWTWGKR